MTCVVWTLSEAFHIWKAVEVMELKKDWLTKQDASKSSATAPVLLLIEERRLSLVENEQDGALLTCMFRCLHRYSSEHRHRGLPSWACQMGWRCSFALRA